MTFSAIVSTVYAIAKAVPVVAEYIDKFYNIYIDKRINEIDQYNITKEDKRAALMSSIEKAENDETRKALSITLADVSKL